MDGGGGDLGGGSMWLFDHDVVWLEACMLLVSVFLSISLRVPSTYLFARSDATFPNFTLSLYLLSLLFLISLSFCVSLISYPSKTLHKSNGNKALSDQSSFKAPHISRCQT